MCSGGFQVAGGRALVTPGARYRQSQAPLIMLATAEIRNWVNIWEIWVLPIVSCPAWIMRRDPVPPLTSPGLIQPRPSPTLAGSSLLDPWYYRLHGSLCSLYSVLYNQTVLDSVFFAKFLLTSFLLAIFFLKLFADISVFCTNYLHNDFVNRNCR